MAVLPGAGSVALLRPTRPGPPVGFASPRPSERSLRHACYLTDREHDLLYILAEQALPVRPLCREGELSFPMVAALWRVPRGRPHRRPLTGAQHGEGPEVVLIKIDSVGVHSDAEDEPARG